MCLVGTVPEQSCSILCSGTMFRPERSIITSYENDDMKIIKSLYRESNPQPSKLHAVSLRNDGLGIDIFFYLIISRP